MGPECNLESTPRYGIVWNGEQSTSEIPPASPLLCPLFLALGEGQVSLYVASLNLRRDHMFYSESSVWVCPQLPCLFMGRDWGGVSTQIPLWLLLSPEQWRIPMDTWPLLCKMPHSFLSCDPQMTMGPLSYELSTALRGEGPSLWQWKGIGRVHVGIPNGLYWVKLLSVSISPHTWASPSSASFWTQWLTPRNGFCKDRTLVYRQLGQMMFLEHFT